MAGATEQQRGTGGFQVPERHASRLRAPAGGPEGRTAAARAAAEAAPTAADAPGRPPVPVAAAAGPSAPGPRDRGADPESAPEAGPEATFGAAPGEGPEVGPEVRAGDQEDGGGPAGQNADDLAEERLALAARVAGERIRLVPRGYGVALTAILVALAGLVGWSVIGTVPSSVHLTGVLVHGDGPQAVPATVAGTVVGVQVKPGDAVRRGQTLATVQASGGGRSPVRASAAGTVLGVVSAPGSAVSPGTSVVSLDPDTGGLTGWLFVRADRGFPVAYGSSVTARLSSGDSVVTVEGSVRRIGGYPVTGAEISRMLGGLPPVFAVPGDGPFRLVTVSMHELTVTGSQRLGLSGTAPSAIPALIPLVADVRTGSVRPIDALLGGS